MARLPTHPGEHLAVELEELGLTATQAAKTLGIPANRLTEIIRARRGVTADTVLRLAAWLGTTPESWMNLQRNYELKTAELAHGDEIRKAVRRYHAAAQPGSGAHHGRPTAVESQANGPEGLLPDPCHAKSLLDWVIDERG